MVTDPEDDGTRDDKLTRNSLSVTPHDHRHHRPIAELDARNHQEVAPPHHATIDGRAENPVLTEVITPRHSHHARGRFCSQRGDQDRLVISQKCT